MSRLLYSVAALALAACGGAAVSQLDSGPETDEGTGADGPRPYRPDMGQERLPDMISRDNLACLALGDFVDPGVLTVLNLDTFTLVADRSLATHRDATIGASFGQCLVTNRLGADTVVRYNPFDGSSGPAIPVGDGNQNAQSSVMLPNGRLFTTIYAPSGESGDLVEVDPDWEEGRPAILRSWSLREYGANPETDTPTASSLALAGETLVIGAQFLQGFSAVVEGQLILLDTETNELDPESIRLGLRNPTDEDKPMVMKPDSGGVVYVSLAGDFFPPNGLGGLVRAHLSDGRTEVVVTDATLNQTPGAVAVSSTDVYLVGSFFDVEAVDPVTGGAGVYRSQVFRIAKSGAGPAMRVYPLDTGTVASIQSIDWNETGACLLIGDQFRGLLCVTADGEVAQAPIQTKRSVLGIAALSN